MKQNYTDDELQTIYKNISNPEFIYVCRDLLLDRIFCAKEEFLEIQNQSDSNGLFLLEIETFDFVNFTLGKKKIDDYIEWIWTNRRIRLYWGDTFNDHIYMEVI